MPTWKLLLCCAVAAAATCAAETPVTSNLRASMLPDISASENPIEELHVDWVADYRESARTSKSWKMDTMAPVDSKDAIVVFHDRDESGAENAVVSFDVKSKPNCVVSVCGEKSWGFISRERCFDLRVAPRSEDGMIRGISAAYTGSRPAASKLYLKLDATNYIDGSDCSYTIQSGSKVQAPELAAAALD